MRELVRMNSTGRKKALPHQKEGDKTGYFYTTSKNKRVSALSKNERTTINGKLRMRRFDPRAWDAEKGKHGMHVWFEEGKIK